MLLENWKLIQKYKNVYHFNVAGFLEKIVVRGRMDIWEMGNFIKYI